MFRYSILFIALFAFNFSTKANERLTIVSGGLKRTFYFYQPKTYKKGTKRPLVIALHAGSQSAKEMISFTRFNPMADRDTFFVAYPSGVDDKWNDGRVIPFESNANKPNDVQFISDLIDYLIANKNVDAERVYVTGLASGAVLCFTLGCQLSDKIQAIAPVAGGMAIDIFKGCKPKNIVNVLAINGQDDPIIPFAGGDIKIYDKTYGKIAGLEETMVYFANYESEIKSTPFRVKKKDLDRTDHTTIVTTTYTNNKFGSDIILYEIKGGGHSWPGSAPLLSPDLTGNVSREMDASTVVWDFFHALY